MTNSTNNKFAKASDESINTTREVLKTSLASIEKLTKTNLDISKKIFEETTHALKEISGVTDPKELFEKVNQLATNTVEHNLSNCRNVCEIMTETQNKINKTLASHIQNAQKNMSNITQEFSKPNSGAGSNFGANAMQNWINTTSQAMDALNKITAGVSKFANDNLKPTAGTTASRSTRKTTKK